MIVILEGADGSGKTTLAKTLVNWGYNKLNVPAKEDVDAYSKYLVYGHDSQIFIADRSFISDLVYRSVDNKEVGTLDFYQIALILTTKIKIIYCKTDTSFNDAITRGEDNITDYYTHKKISDAYDTVISIIYKFARVNVMTYDWSKNKLSDVINFIEGGN